MSFIQDCTTSCFDLHALSVQPPCAQFTPDGSKGTLHPNVAYLLQVIPAAFELSTTTLGFPAAQLDLMKRLSNWEMTVVTHAYIRGWLPSPQVI